MDNCAYMHCYGKVMLAGVVVWVISYLPHMAVPNEMFHLHEHINTLITCYGAPREGAPQ